MKPFALKTILFALAALTLAVCGPATEPAPVELTLPTVQAAATTPPSAATTSEADQPAQPAAFSPASKTATYRDEATCFELDYPAGWALDDGERHSRGYCKKAGGEPDPDDR